MKIVFYERDRAHKISNSLLIYTKKSNSWACAYNQWEEIYMIMTMHGVVVGLKIIYMRKGLAIYEQWKNSKAVSDKDMFMRGERVH